MSQSTSHHYSAPFLNRRIELVDNERTRTEKSLRLAIGLLAVSLFVLLMPDLPLLYSLACGASIFCCSLIVLSHGAKRSIRFVKTGLGATTADRIGNMALLYAALFALTVVVIVAEILRVVAGW